MFEVKQNVMKLKNKEFDIIEYDMINSWNVILHYLGYDNIIKEIEGMDKRQRMEYIRFLVATDYPNLMNEMENTWREWIQEFVDLNKIEKKDVVKVFYDAIYLEPEKEIKHLTTKHITFRIRFHEKPLKLNMITENEVELYHRTKLSISEDDTSFFKYLMKYGIMCIKDKKESNGNYLKRGIYTALTDKENPRAFDKNYGSWIIKCSADYRNMFIIDWRLYNHFYGYTSPEDYLWYQFRKFGTTFDRKKVKTHWIYNKMYYKIYREIEKDIDKIRNTIDGIMFYEFNYLLDNTDTNFIKNKRIDNYQAVIYNPKILTGYSIKWKDGFYMALPCKGTEFILEDYNKYVNEFAKGNDVSFNTFKLKYGYEFNMAIWNDKIEKSLFKIYKRINYNELVEYRDILPNKFKISQFNPGIDIINKIIEERKDE